MPKTYWWSCTSCRKFWWIDNSRVHNTWRKLWISKKSPICFIGAIFGYSMDSIISVQQKLDRKKKRACQSSWDQPENQKLFTLTIPWHAGSSSSTKPFWRNMRRRTLCWWKMKIAKNESRVERDEDRSFRRKNMKRKEIGRMIEEMFAVLKEMAARSTDHKLEKNPEEQNDERSQKVRWKKEEQGEKQRSSVAQSLGNKGRGAKVEEI